jgi:hypothetical protein
MLHYVAFGFLFFSLAHASEVKITSFQYLGNARVAELCGVIEGVTKSGELVEVIVDPKMKAPGHYTALASSTGKFCLVLRTLSGEADVTHGDHTVGALYQSK